MKTKTKTGTLDEVRKERDNAVAAMEDERRKCGRAERAKKVSEREADELRYSLKRALEENAELGRLRVEDAKKVAILNMEKESKTERAVMVEERRRLQGGMAEDDVRVERDALRAMYEVLEGKLEELVVERDTALSEVRVFQEAMAMLTEDRDGLAKERDEAVADRTELRRNIGQLSRRTEASLAEKDDSRRATEIEVVSMRKENERLKSELDALMEERNGLRMRCDALSETLERERVRVKVLEEGMKTVGDERETLRIWMDELMLDDRFGDSSEPTAHETLPEGHQASGSENEQDVLAVQRPETRGDPLQSSGVDASRTEEDRPEADGRVTVDSKFYPPPFYDEGCLMCGLTIPPHTQSLRFTLDRASGPNLRSNHIHLLLILSYWSIKTSCTVTVYQTGARWQNGLYERMACSESSP